MKKLTANLLAMMLLLASTCCAESLTDELGLTTEPKPATAYTAEVNSAVYSMLDFADSDKISDWAVEAFKWACDTGLFKGDEGNLNPQADTKRSELATLIMRFSEQIEG